MNWFKSNISQQRLLTLMMVLVLLSFGTITSFADEEIPPISTPEVISLIGSGTQDAPYEIATCEDLQKINNHLDASYLLVSDVDCSNSNTMNNGDGFIAIGTFTGAYFDGRNFAIRNLTISEDQTNALGVIQSVGRFSKVRNIKFENIVITNTYSNDPESISTGIITGLNEGLIENVSLNNVTVNSQGIIGVAAGYNTGTIQYVSASGQINLSTAIQNTIGGIAGYNTGNISNVVSGVTITNTVDSESFCGGIVGVSAGGQIDKVLANSLLDCRGALTVQGGIVGQTSNDAIVTLSLSNSRYNQQIDVLDGGIIGNNQSNADLSGSTFDATSAGVNYCDDLTSTSCQVINQNGDQSTYFLGNANFTPVNQWDVSTVWNIQEGSLPWLLTRAMVTLAPTDFRHSSTNGDILNFEWTAPNDYGNPILRYRVEVSTDNGQTWSMADLPGGTGSSNFVADINQVYQFRVIAENYIGDGYPSATITVASPPQPITNVTVAKVDAKSITINWEDTSTEPSLATGYNVQYKKTSDSEWSSAFYSRFPETSMPIANLAESTNYEVRVQSYNGRGYTDFSAPVTATTLVVDAHVINNCDDLQNMNNDLYANYTLASDIDCSATENWNDGKGFSPVGTFDQPFAGTLNGQGHSIINLQMVRNDQPGGIFAFAYRATISNVKLDGGIIDHSATDGFNLGVFDGTSLNQLPIAGSFIGVGASITLDNVESNIPVYTSRVFGLSGGLIGGLASNYFLGDATTQPTVITNSSSKSVVEGYIAGGISAVAIPVYLINNAANAANVANATVDIENVVRSGNTNCSQACSGGIAISALNTHIDNMLNSGSVTTNLTDTGVELQEGDISQSCSFQSTGGLIGAQAVFPLSITNSSNTGNISSTTRDAQSACGGFEGFGQGIGGIIGTFISPVDGLFDMLIPNYVGSTLGKNKLTIANTSSSGNVQTNVLYYAGGLAGFVFGDALLDNTSASGNVTSTYNADPMFAVRLNHAATGGLVGKILGAVEVTMNTSGGDLPRVKVMNAEIKNSHASGVVYSNNISGGLIGSLAAMTDVSKSYATGTVTGNVAGGFLGATASSALDVLNLIGSINVENTYSTGSVYARAKSDMLTVAGGYLGLGAFVGELNIKNSYSSGAVRVENNSATNRSVFGGFAGAIINASAAASMIPAEVVVMLSSVGITLHDELNVENVFTVSTVPPTSDSSGLLPYFSSKENVSPGVMSGSMFGITLAVGGSDFLVVDPDDYIENNYFVSETSSDLSCGFTANDFVTEQGPTIPTLTPFTNGVCGSAPSASSFVNTTTQAPLNGWNFASTVWHKHANGYPTFTADPVSPPPPDPPNPPQPPTDPPGVSPPEIRTISNETVKTVIKYVTRSVNNPEVIKDSTLGTTTNIFDTPEIARVLGKDITKPKAAQDAQHAQGWLSGLFNLLMKYLGYIILTIIIGGLITYITYQQKKVGRVGSAQEDIDEVVKQPETSYLAHVASPTINDSPERSWDSPPKWPPGDYPDI